MIYENHSKGRMPINRSHSAGEGSDWSYSQARKVLSETLIFAATQPGLNRLHHQMIAQSPGSRREDLQRAEFLVGKAHFHSYYALCTSQHLSQPPLALSVPLSRFTPQIGSGSAFFIRRYEESKERFKSSPLRFPFLRDFGRFVFSSRHP
jgi:hypothetical protein